MLRKLLSIVVLFAALLHSARAAPFSTPQSLSIPPVSIHRERSTSDEELTAWTVRCGYAISGMFCTTQRYTVYFIAVGTLLFRFHDWLTAIGVAYLITYTVTTAIYGAALALDPAIGTDADYVMIGNILLISAMITWLFLRFARHIFKVSGKTTLWLWYCIIVVAFIIVEARRSTFWSHFYRVRAVEVCNSSNLCLNTCSSVMASSKFRGTGDEIMPIQSTKRRLAVPVNSSLSIDEFLGAAVNFTTNLPVPGYRSNNSFDPKFIPVIVVYALGFINWAIPPRSIRNTLSKLILVGKQTKEDSTQSLMTEAPSMASAVAGKKNERRQAASPKRRKKTPSAISIRTELAKALAMLCYILYSLTILAFPAILTWTIVKAEIYIRESPRFDEQEGPRNVGQWGPCVSVALAAVAALLDRQSSRSGSESDIWSLMEKSKPPECERPSWLFGWEEGWYWYAVIRDEWLDFVAWWRKPV
ncbi:uncharacterized protein BDR25DRAFT_56656 [Lindgomyces ingoldianus]|uniref:Uncharacterized protein n=1 Tax=Lindgomyces ingoldianus TaxID=673940 RepID=A0ACB6QN62_9PLEO|nr:uncharacterized protein BDR25DRAFT_56656 [Lindgomyces ingoldianus]KAF2468346.1 hypothetical protein BDR25DRAFT_56656 [Lindgomyces ingoldianus]